MVTGDSDCVDGMLRHTAALFPTREAIVVGERRLTYAGLVAEVDRVGRQLRRSGVAAGDRVVYWGPNVADAYVLLFAAAAVRAVFVPTNLKLKVPEIEHVLATSGATMFVYSAEGLEPGARDRLDQILAGWASGRLAATSPALRVLRSTTDLGAQGAGSGEPADGEAGGSPGPLGTDPVLMQFTSGTTGLPKGALLANRPTVRMARSLAGNFGLSPADRYFVCNPICHLGGTTFSLLAAMSSGACFVTLPHFRADDALRTIRAERCTMVHGIDAHWSLQLAALGDTDFDHPLRLCSVGGPDELVRRVHQRFRPRVTITCYGTTEIGGAPVCGHYLDEQEMILSSEGRPLSGVAVSIVDPVSEQVLPAGRTGEIRVGGWSLMLGYVSRPSETAAQRDGRGHCRTGDLGCLDDDGYLHFVGRMKNIIRVGGENVSAEEIEGVLESHPEVSRALACPVPDEVRGEVVFAFVVLAPGATTTPAELGDFALTRMASFKVPKHVELVTLADLPLTDSGKFNRAQARQLARRLVGEAGARAGS